jgi:hypothetical protein
VEAEGWRNEEDTERVISICWKNARQGFSSLSTKVEEKRRATHNAEELMHQKKQPHNASDERREF